MSAVHVYLAKKSVCTCGFPLLDDRIVPGRQTDYYASPDRSVPITFICGGCSKAIHLHAWFIHAKEWPWGTSKPGFLPACAFALFEDEL